MTLHVSYLNDNLGGSASTLNPNDGRLAFGCEIAVNAGDRVTILPGSLTFGYSAAFNPPLAAFNGNVFFDELSGYPFERTHRR